MHRDNLDVPVGEFVDVLNDLHAAGRIGAFGGSNWSVARFEEARAFAEAADRRPLSILNNNLSPLLAEKVNLNFALWFGAMLSAFCVVCGDMVNAMPTFVDAVNDKTERVILDNNVAVLHAKGQITSEDELLRKALMAVLEPDQMIDLNILNSCIVAATDAAVTQTMGKDTLKKKPLQLADDQAPGVDGTHFPAITCYHPDERVLQILLQQNHYDVLGVRIVFTRMREALQATSDKCGILTRKPIDRKEPVDVVQIKKMGPPSMEKYEKMAEAVETDCAAAEGEVVWILACERREGNEFIVGAYNGTCHIRCITCHTNVLTSFNT